MLGRESTNYKGDGLETIIGPSVKVKGNFNSQGNVKIEGALEGSLNTTGDVKIGSGAKIKANVTARKLHISGKVEGTIKATEKLILTSTAVINGDIETQSLAIEEGAFVNGKCTMEKGASKVTATDKKDDDKTKENKK